MLQGTRVQVQVLKPHKPIQETSEEVLDFKAGSLCLMLFMKGSFNSWDSFFMIAVIAFPNSWDNFFIIDVTAFLDRWDNLFRTAMTADPVA